MCESINSVLISASGIITSTCQKAARVRLATNYTHSANAMKTEGTNPSAVQDLINSKQASAQMSSIQDSKI